MRYNNIQEIWNKSNSKERKILKRCITRESKEFSDDFKEIDIDEHQMVNGLIRAFRNNKFLVQVYKPSSGLTRLTVCRTELNEHGGWKDNISWDELNWIKNELGYEREDAVEIYPKEQDIVNVANMRHLWVFIADHDLDFIWRNK